MQLREARRCPDGKLRLQVPGRPGLAIDVVDSYVHLGTHACVDGSCFKNASHRCSSAMAAYAPLSSKIFGAESVPIPHKLCFMTTLVMSRLLFFGVCHCAGAERC